VTAAHEPRAPGRGDESEPPPLLGTWPRAYALVIGALALAIVLLGLLTRGCA
jgi:hypothetical protein